MDETSQYSIRGYKASDRIAVRKLCCATGFLGAPIDPVFQDRELFADFLTTYYTDHEPESSFVLEVDGEIRGYLLGSRRYIPSLTPCFCSFARFGDTAATTTAPGSLFAG